MARAVTTAVEGTTDAAVARRLLTEAGYVPGLEYVNDGKAALDRRLGGFNNAARLSCWLVLRDMDRDAACAPELLRKACRPRPLTCGCTLLCAQLKRGSPCALPRGPPP